LPTPTRACNPEVVRSFLEELDATYQAWDDNAILVADTWKAAGYQADSSAVVTAISALVAADRAIGRLQTPECATQVHYSLYAYTHAMTRDYRRCIFDNDCSDLEYSGSEEWTDFQAHRRFVVCLLDDPGRGSGCSYPFYANMYDSDGTLQLTASGQATSDALAAPYRTQAAMTAQP